MDYYEAANALFGLRRYPPRPGIESTAGLLSHLGDPHEGLTCVQVAGSNGKGTTARMTERILRETGLSVGLYTSPHLDDVRERVRTDGRPVRKTAVTEFVEEMDDYTTRRGAEGDPVTFFEALTGLALWEFDRQDVDVAVLEVGLGGRYDATSAVDPVASALTGVALEHTEFLGDTIEEIARDKAHVAPDGNPLVTATEGEALSAVREVAGEVVTVGRDDADVVVAYGGRRDHTEADVTLSGPDWIVETAIPALGVHQAANAGVATALARATADAVGADLDRGTIERGLRGARWPGRFEVMGTEPLVVLDGAHNPDACEALARTLGEFEYDDLHLVFGAMVDKDHAGMADALPDADRAVTCRPWMDRAEHQDTLAAVFDDPADAIESKGTVSAVLADALDAADPGDCVLVTGSLHVVGEARRRWTDLRVEKQVDSIPEARDLLANATVTREGTWRMRGKAVHRLLKARVQPKQANYLKEELLSLGGECATSGINDDEERQEVVMMATMAQFKRLAEKLQGQPYGLPGIGDDVRRSLGIGTDDPPRRRLGIGDRSDGGESSTPSGFDWLGECETAVMGILNVTPDSFHDGGEYDAVSAVVDRAREMVEAGVDVLDVGGESTRPGADPVPPEEERDRVVPAIEAIREAGIEAPISIDTRKASVAEGALEAGADLVNDVSGLEDPDLARVTAEADAGLVVMHSVETPVDPGKEIRYDDVVEDILAHLRDRVVVAERAGIDPDRILVDPGVGFGKTAAEDFEIVDRLREFRALGCPVLVGHSHKSMFGAIGCDPDERLPPTIAVSALAADRGADVVRVHDPENVPAVRAAMAVNDPDRFVEE